jgi:U3 small nucleolar RNA-associated protein 12
MLQENIPDILLYESKYSLHKSEITCLEFNEKDNQLLSGSKDTQIFLWDIISETILYRYSGHKDAIIKASFYELNLENLLNNDKNEKNEKNNDKISNCLNIIISCSKDNTLKIWNKNTQECLQTISNLISKINYFTLFEDILILGTYDNKLNLYKLHMNQSSKDLNTQVIAHLKGSLLRKSGAKITYMSVVKNLNNSNSNVLTVFSKDKTVEFFKILTHKEIENRINLNETKKLLQVIKNTFSKENRDEVIDEEKVNFYKKNFDEIKERSKKIKNLEDYNFSLRFFSLFKFFEEQEIINLFFLEKDMFTTNNNKNSNVIKKIDFKVCFSTEKNLIEVYEVSASCLSENLFKLSSDFRTLTNSFFSNEINYLNTKTIDKNLNEIVQPRISESNLKVKHLFSIDKGHSEIIRWVKFSSSNTKFLSASNDCVRIWNYRNKTKDINNSEISISGKNIKFVPENSVKKVCFEQKDEDGNIVYESPLTAVFIKGDEFIAIGTKQGNIHLVEVNSAVIISSIHGHKGEIWNIVSLKIKDEFFCVSCSSDKKINYYKINFDKTEENFEEKENNENNENNDEDEDMISIVNTLDTSDQITFMQITANKKFLIYSLLDNTIRVLYSDSGKEFLNLHGHKLPVLCFDSSSDGTILVSGSSDKNIKIWGLDFGNIHHSLFAHYDAVTTIKFVNKTHYFFSGSKDGIIKYWDADSVRKYLFFILFFHNII